MRFDENPFTYQREKGDKGLNISNFPLLLAIFKWHHGSKGVNLTPLVSERLPTESDSELSDKTGGRKNGVFRRRVLIG